MGWRGLAGAAKTTAWAAALVAAVFKQHAIAPATGRADRAATTAQTASGAATNEAEFRIDATLKIAAQR
jgi:hypothetical protein